MKKDGEREREREGEKESERKREREGVKDMRENSEEVNGGGRLVGEIYCVMSEEV